MQLTLKGLSVQRMAAAAALAFVYLPPAAQADSGPAPRLRRAHACRPGVGRVIFSRDAIPAVRQDYDVFAINPTAAASPT